MSERNPFTRREFLSEAGKAILGGSAVLGFARRTDAAESLPRRKPNLIVILADDLGYGDLGCYGSERNPSPHLDALAAGGIRFTDFHANGAVCSPTRAALMTGRYQQRCGIVEVLFAASDRDKGLPRSEITFAKRLKDAGYATGVFGKWHLGYDPKFNPTHFGFDRFRGYVSGNIDYISHLDGTGVPDWWDNATPITEEGYTTHLVHKHAVQFIEENKDRPFCLYVANEAVHSPYQGPNDPRQRFPGGGGKLVNPPKDRGRTYTEMIKAMDDGVGQIMATLKRLGLERDTFVFFFSDNGAVPVGSNAPLRGFKSSLWEGGHREPAIAYWPGKIPAGKVCDELTIGMDLYPTVLAVAGAAVADERNLDGVSLFSLLTERKSLGERTLFWAYGEQRAVRQGPWKLDVSVRNQTSSPALFHLAKDIGEKNDLAAAEPGRVKAMLAALAAWEKNVGVNASAGAPAKRKKAKAGEKKRGE